MPIHGNVPTWGLGQVKKTRAGETDEGELTRVDFVEHLLRGTQIYQRQRCLATHGGTKSYPILHVPLELGFLRMSLVEGTMGNSSLTFCLSSIRMDGMDMDGAECVCAYPCFQSPHFLSQHYKEAVKFCFRSFCMFCQRFISGRCGYAKHEHHGKGIYKR